MTKNPNDNSLLDRFKDINPKEINWFPGHMFKAGKQLQQTLKRVDVVLELRDARIPLASVNLEFEKLLGEKKRLVLFNKTSLAEEETIQDWVRYFKVQGISFIFIDVLEKRGLKRVLPEIRKMMKPRQERFERKGITPPALRLMVIGIPNVGKSSLINGLTRRKATETGPTPGVTRHQEWIVLDRDVELLDTPGILFPKIATLEMGLQLTLTGAIKDEIVGRERIAEYLLSVLQERDASVFFEHYKLNPQHQELEAPQLLEIIGQKRGCLKKGGVDLERASAMLLKDFRSGKLGRISLETLRNS